jgi:methanogenic corrinoid protein MtbC1
MVNCPQKGPLVWVACAPGEMHEVGALLLVLYLRRAGVQTQYLGKDIPVADFVSGVQQQRPALVLFSATTAAVYMPLCNLAAALAQIGLSAPLVGYGGQLFSRNPDLCTKMAGVHLGDSAYSAVEAVSELLFNPQHHN